MKLKIDTTLMAAMCLMLASIAGGCFFFQDAPAMQIEARNFENTWFNFTAEVKFESSGPDSFDEQFQANLAPGESRILFERANIEGVGTMQVSAFAVEEAREIYENWGDGAPRLWRITNHKGISIYAASPD